MLSVFTTLAHNSVMRAEHDRAEPITPPGVNRIDKERAFSFRQLGPSVNQAACSKDEGWFD